MQEANENRPTGQRGEQHEQAIVNRNGDAVDRAQPDRAPEHGGTTLAHAPAGSRPPIHPASAPSVRHRNYERDHQDFDQGFDTLNGSRPLPIASASKPPITGSPYGFVR